MLAVTRGEGISGEKGKGFAGTSIKNTWTITRQVWKQGREVGKSRQANLKAATQDSPK